MKVALSVGSGIRLARWMGWLALWPVMVMATLERGSDEIAAQAVVQIEVVRQMQDFSRRSVAYLSAQEEFVQFSKILEAALRARELEATFVIRRFPGKMDPALPRITLYLHEWEAHRDGQVRAVIGARTRWKDVVSELGTFSGRASVPITTVRSLRDRSYHDAMRKACEAFAEELKEQLLSRDGVWPIKDAEGE